MKDLVAEVLGTFVVVFAGTGALVVDEISGGSVTHAGVALTFGLSVASMILVLGGISGAHLNPAVTIGLSAAERFPVRRAPAYVIAQCVGALGASVLVKCLFPSHATLGATVPTGSILPAFSLETGMTFALVLVLLCLSGGMRRGRLGLAVAVGAVVGLEALFGGPISGASMNPARSLAPAIVAGRLGPLWIYLSAPLLGALLAVPACRRVRARGCCGGERGACPS